MGMTINDLITGLQSIKAFLDYSEFKGLEEQTKIQCSVIDGAIETMRKYQKIVSIVSLNGEEFKQCGLKELKEILEVIADGNDTKEQTNE